MYILASEMVGRPVFVHDEGQVGQVQGLVINPENGSLITLLVTPGGLFAKPLFLTVADIQNSTRDGILIHQAEKLVEPQEITRAYASWQAHIPVLGQHAQTESGTSLGQVHDLLFETEGWTIQKYYLKGLMSERILAADQVHSITKEAVIFLDKVEEPPVVPAPTEIAAA